MVHKKTTIVYVCDVCEKEYDTEGEANICENVPMSNCNLVSIDGNEVHKFNDWEIGREYMVKRNAKAYIPCKIVAAFRYPGESYNEGHEVHPLFIDAEGERFPHIPGMNVKKVDNDNRT